jgi:ABC-2 type transport system permease protein
MYHSRVTFATARRVLQQLSHDKRTLGLLFVVPCMLISLMAWMFGSKSMIFQMAGAPLLGIFPFVVMFLVTSITTLRERSAGTLERLLALPAGRLDILLGYTLTFGLLAVVQAVLVSSLALYGLGLEVDGPQWFLVIVAVINALLGTTLGLFVSAFARTEFQAVQFLPAFFFPQLLLCGLFLPVEQLPAVLEAIANCLPLTYAVDAMQQVTRHVSLPAAAWQDVAVVIGFALTAVLLGGMTLRRRTK